MRMVGPRADIGKARIAAVSLTLSDQLHKCRPMLVSVDDRADHPVLGLVGSPFLIERTLVPGGAKRWLKSLAAHMITQHPLRHRFKHRHFNLLPTPSFLAVVNRREQGDCARQARCPIIQRQRHIMWCF